MKKTTQTIAKITLALSLLCAMPFAQNPKIAVYVSEQSSYSNSEKEALKIATISILANRGYEVVERSSVIDEELSRQASGAVDDDQMVKFGRQAGAKYVCVSDITSFGRYHVSAKYDSKGRQISNSYYVHPHQVSARIIDVETAQLVGLGVIEKDIQNGPAMSAAITETVEKMLGTMSDKMDSNLPKKAVYVQGGGRNNPKTNALYTYTLEALFTRSRYNGDFVVVERSEAFTRQINREHGKQRSGAVADDEISRMGKQYGITEICIASIELVMGTYNINARLVNVERASVVKASQLRHLKESSAEGGLNNLRSIAVQMVEDIIPRHMTEAELEENLRIDTEIEEATRTAWMAGFAIGGGISLNMNEIEPNYFKSFGGQFNTNVELFRQHLKFLRLGINLDLGSVSIHNDEVRRVRPNVLTDDSNMTTFNAKINTFLRLYPASFLFLSGGAGWAWYNTWAKELKPDNSSTERVKVINISTPIFPVGGGIILGSGDSGIVLEALYNIVPFKGRTAAYITLNAGLKGCIRITEDKKHVRQMI